MRSRKRTGNCCPCYIEGPQVLSLRGVALVNKKFHGFWSFEIERSGRVGRAKTSNSEGLSRCGHSGL